MPEYLKNATDPTTLATIALLVGAIVRILKTKKVGDLLDAIPLTKKIPKDWLPWIAVLLGVGIAIVDARINGGALTWKDALVTAVAGALAGSGAVAGHETLAKAFKPKEDHAPKIVALLSIGSLFGLGLLACTAGQQAKGIDLAADKAKCVVENNGLSDPDVWAKCLVKDPEKYLDLLTSSRQVVAAAKGQVDAGTDSAR